MAKLPDAGDYWLSMECCQTFKDIPKEAKKNFQDERTIVSLRTFLILLYHLEQQSQMEQIKLIEVDAEPWKDQWLIQRFEWEHEDGLYPLWVFISHERIMAYPGIDSHLAILRKIGFPT